MTETVGMGTLEHRYRQLLHLFPHRHRDRFLEEMVTTLMEGAAPQQRFPRAKETADLLWNAAWLRFSRRGLPGARDPQWTDAAAIAGLIGSFILFATWAMGPLAERLRWMRYGFINIDMWHDKILQVGMAWLLVAIVALIGLRVAAAVGAWLITLAHLGYRLLFYSENPPLLTEDWPLIVGGVIVAICLTVRSPKHRARDLLGSKLTGLTSGVLFLFCVSGYADSLLIFIEPHADGRGFSSGGYGDFFNIPGLPAGLVSLLLVVVAVVMLILGLVKSGRAIRRRLLAIAFPALLMMPIMRIGYEGYEASSMRFFPTPVLLTAPQWLIMTLLPVLIFMLGVILVRRADQRDELMELGRLELARRNDSGPQAA